MEDLSVVKYFLDEKVEQYNHVEFIEPDPVSVPHGFSLKEDIEISGFLAATIAWGNRKSILKSSGKIIKYLDNQPFDFIMNHTPADLKKIQGSVHRTFNSDDLVFFIKSLQNIYVNKGGLEKVFAVKENEVNTYHALERFRNVFFEIEHSLRTRKHISSPARNSSAKRLSMFLRWMVRKDNKGVDFGIWNSIKPSQLVCPLDVHSGNTARMLKLLNRTQNDWKSVLELQENLVTLDKEDPSKYDFALFGLGVFEQFSSNK